MGLYTGIFICLSVLGAFLYRNNKLYFREKKTKVLNAGFALFAVLFELLCIFAAWKFEELGNWVSSLAAWLSSFTQYLEVTGAWLVVTLIFSFYTLVKQAAIIPLLSAAKDDSDFFLAWNFAHKWKLKKHFYLFKTIALAGLVIFLLSFLLHWWLAGKFLFAPAWLLLNFLVVFEIFMFFYLMELDDSKWREAINMEKEQLKDLADFEKLWRYFHSDKWPDERLLISLKELNTRNDTANTEDAKTQPTNSHSLSAQFLSGSPYYTQNIRSLVDKLNTEKQLIISDIDPELSQYTVWDKVCMALHEGTNILVLLPERNLYDNNAKGERITGAYYTTVNDWIKETLNKLLIAHYFVIDDYSCTAPHAEIKGEILLTSGFDLMFGSILNSTWFNNVGLVLVIGYEKQSLFSNLNNLVLSHVLSKRSPDAALYILADKRRELETGLRSALYRYPKIKEHNLERILSRFQYLLIWKDEGLPFYLNLFFDGGEYLGDAGILTLPAVNLKIPHIALYNTSHWPTAEILEEISNRQHQLECERLPDESDARDKTLIEQKVKTIKDHQFTHPLASSCSIVYDFRFNAAATLNDVNSFSREILFIHLVSPPYLLREYICDNIDYFKRSPVEALAGFHVPSPYDTVYMLYRLMGYSKIEESRVKQELIDGGISFDNTLPVIKNLCNCFQAYLGIEPGEFMRTVEITDETVFQVDQRTEQNRFVTTTYFSMPPGASHRFDFELNVELQEGVIYNDLPLEILPKGLFFQKYLYGQIHSFKGKPYLIQDLSEGGAVMKVHHDSGHGKITLYRSSVQITLQQTELKPLNQWHKTIRNRCSLIISELDFTVTTTGYFTVRERADFANDANFTALDVNREGLKRSYRKGRGLQIIIPFSALPKIKEPGKMETALCFLLNEFIKTLFPEVWEYLHVTSVNSKPFVCDNTNEQGFMIPALQHQLTGSESQIHLIVFEDSRLDLGMIGSLYHNFEKYLLDLMDDYLYWTLEEQYDGVEKIRGDDRCKLSGSLPTDVNIKVEEIILEPITRSSRISDKQSYLKAFGPLGQNINLKQLKMLLDEIRHEGVNERTLKREGRQSATGRGGEVMHQCDFCGVTKSKEKMKVIQNDGREICPECIADIQCTEGDLIKCLDTARQFMTTRFSITLPDPIEVHFVNTAVINRFAQKPWKPTPGFDDRTIGLAFSTENKILIETGTPKNRIIRTLIHELTHIWQYMNMDMQTLHNDNPVFELWLMEGHATWAEIQFEPEMENVIVPDTRKDEYGEGYRMLLRMMTEAGETNAFSFVSKKYGV